MFTYKQLKDFCAKTGTKFEVNPKLYGTRYDLPEDRFQIGTYFGMNNIAGKSGKSEWQWVWFESYDTELTDSSLFFFAERYSQVCGRSYTGFSEAIKNEAIIIRRMEA